MTQLEPFDYRRPTTSVARRPVLRKRVLVTACVLFAVSAACCAATLSSPRRFIFLPFGDVAYGFRSYAGRLDWIQYAPWQQDPDWVEWSLPWPKALGFEAAVIALCLLPGTPPARRRSGGG